MATRTVVCPECDAPVPYGRLSCPSCGSLLASVAGAPRRQAPLPSVAVAELPSLAEDDGSNGHGPAKAGAATPATTRARRTNGRATRSASTREAATTTPAGEQPDVVPPAPATPDPADPAPPEPATPAVDPALPADDVAPAGAPGDLDDAAEPAPSEVDVPRWPGETATPEWRRTEVADLAARPAAAAASNGESVPAWPSSSAASWLQPATTTSEPVPSPHAMPALPPTPAGSWLPPSASFGPAQPNGATLGNGHASGAPKSDKAKPGQASFLADLPFDAPNDLAGWLVAIGSGIALVGFFLPWSARMPFTSALGYTDRWGLATPSHLILLIATLLLFLSSVRPSRIPVWLRAGIAPIGLGGVLLGIVWPFVIGGFGSQVGSLAVAMASMILVIAGTLVLRPERHDERRPGV